jgi:Flavodoxin reductases (ferredoxin-NADPH reductases) family 1
LQNVWRKNYEGKTFMLCGPDKMMQTMKVFLEEQGVDKKRIRMESFVN